MDKIGIVGLGLIGCSLAMSLNDSYEVVGVDSDRDAVSYCVQNGIITAQGLTALRGCKAVFVAVPVNAVERTVKQVHTIVGDSAVITDTASVKGYLKDMPPRFVGGHPMAGTEQSGCRAARKGLMENAFYILTYDKENEALSADAETVSEIVKKAGAIPVHMSAQEHDRAVSMVSHLPHMVAYALANCVLSPRDNYGELASGGFLDTTRIASSSPDLWQSVVKANREEVLSAMDDFISQFLTLRGYIEQGSGVKARAFFADGKRRRDNLLTTKRYNSQYHVYVDVKDEVGALSGITTLLGGGGVDLKSIRIINSREGVGGALRLGFKDLSNYERAVGLLKENGYL